MSHAIVLSGEHDDPRAERQREIQVVRHRDARAAGRRLVAQQAEAVQLLIDVEKRRRLVEQQERRLLREARGKQHPLALAAAQRGDAAIAKHQALARRHRVLGRAAIRVGFEPPVGVGIASHQHELLDA